MKKILLFLCAVFMAAPTVARAAECNVESCVTCSSFDANYCMKCETGYTLKLSTHSCIKIMDHCIDQASSKLCEKCEDGWILSKTGYLEAGCYKPVDHCIDQFGNSCLECETGWIAGAADSSYISKVCYKNTVEHCNGKDYHDENREKESGYKQCGSCEKGYGFTEYGGSSATPSRDTKCVPCDDQNAEDCSHYEVSESCKPGYVLSEYSNNKRQCVMMVDNCTDYSLYSCYKCKDGYTLSADRKSCEKKAACPENAACSDGNVTCNSGYVLKDGACVKCPANCSACSSSTACTACNAGYSLIGGQCAEGTVAKCPDDSTM